jgi:hypothetical protein
MNALTNLPVTSVTLQTSPASLLVLVGGAAFTAPVVVSSLIPGSNYTVATETPQTGAPGTRYIWQNWSDGGAISHSIVVPATDTTYTANFQTEYQLTISASPAAGGTITPANGTYYNSGTVVPIVATPSAGYTFSGWSGAVANANNASTTVTMDAAKIVTADFSSTTGITIHTSPEGLQFSVDGGAALTAPKTLTLSQGTHTIAVTGTQAGANGTQSVFTQWSDNNTTNPRTITVGSAAATYTADFQIQYQLTISASPSADGSVTPASGTYYNSGSVVPIAAFAYFECAFSYWTGTVADVNLASTTVTMSAPETVTAKFVPVIAVTIQTSPEGLQFSVDGGASQTAPQLIYLTQAAHTIAVAATQAGPAGAAAGTQDLFTQWSDNNTANPRTITVGSSAATYTADFQTQYLLTISASPSADGTVTPASGMYYNSGTVVPIAATANAGYTFNNWMGTVADVNAASTIVNMSAPETVKANFMPVSAITIHTSPEGLLFSVDGGPQQTAPQTINLTQVAHTIAVAVTQAGPAGTPAGTQYAFSSWNDNGTASHSITVGFVGHTYTASFTTQYQLTISASPAVGGTVTPATSAFYNAGTVEPVNAVANAGYMFNGWSEPVANASNASTTVTMSAPENVIANFSSTSGIQTSPPGLQFSVDNGASQTAPQTLTLSQGTHPIAVVITQAGGIGTQFVFTSWSDRGAASHSITVGASATTYTAAFQTQYQLTTAALPGSGGVVSPATGQFYNSGTNVTVTAAATAPYAFSSWSGGATGISNPITVTMSGPASVTGNFALPVLQCQPTGDQAPSVADVQLIVNQALGAAPAANDLNGDGVVNVVDIQIVINAALSLGCATR